MVSAYLPGRKIIQLLVRRFAFTAGLLLLCTAAALPRSALAAVCPRTVSANFDGNCNSDILWQDSVSGLTAIWFMNGSTLSSSSLTTAPGTGWIAVGTGDFNQDGKADIVWQNQNSGAIVVWLMNGSSILQLNNQSATFVLGTPGPNWIVQGVGKFDNTGQPGLVLRDTNSGTVVVWSTSFTNNGGVPSLTIANPTTLGVPGPNWNLQGVGDFDGNGISDILWRDANTGTLDIWLLTFTGGTLAIGPATGVINSVPPFNWSVQGIGDFDGNGTSDILWRDSQSGAVAVWQMNGTTISQTSEPGIPAADNSTACCVGQGNGWTIAGVGDFDGNGTSDILWRNANGAVSVWLMNLTPGAPPGPGVSITGSGSPGAPASDWQVDAYAPYLCQTQVQCNIQIGINNVRLNGPYGPGNPSPSPALLPMTWDPGAAALAQAWAAQCNFSHRPNNPYGENIYAAGSTSTPVTVTGTDAASSWNSEAQNYVYSSNTCTSGECGHYTQDVWRFTTALGCAVQQCTTNSPFGGSFPDWALVVCDFSPPGNFPTQPY